MALGGWGRLLKRLRLFSELLVFPLGVPDGVLLEAGKVNRRWGLWWGIWGRGEEMGGVPRPSFHPFSGAWLSLCRTRFSPLRSLFFFHSLIPSLWVSLSSPRIICFSGDLSSRCAYCRRFRATRTGSSVQSPAVSGGPHLSIYFTFKSETLVLQKRNTDLHYYYYFLH